MLSWKEESSAQKKGGLKSAGSGSYNSPKGPLNYRGSFEDKQGSSSDHYIAGKYDNLWSHTAAAESFDAPAPSESSKAPVTKPAAPKLPVNTDLGDLPLGLDGALGSPLQGKSSAAAAEVKPAKLAAKDEQALLEELQLKLGIALDPVPADCLKNLPHSPTHKAGSPSVNSPKAGGDHYLAGKYDNLWSKTSAAAEMYDNSK